MESRMEKRTCRVCHQEKDIAEFGIDKHRGTRATACKVCHEEKSNKFANWLARNRERRKEYCSQWHSENKDKENARHQQWKKDHPDKNAAHQAKRVRVIAQNSDGTLGSDPLQQAIDRYGNRCFYCGMDGVKLGIDHVVPLCNGGKHSIENVVPACRDCNERKARKPKNEFMTRTNHEY
jgi:5-methylcytosine-specific restriction endonuclease McrA